MSALTFEVLTAVNIKIKFFWDMMTFSFEDRDQHFEGPAPSIVRAKNIVLHNSTLNKQAASSSQMLVLI
jgi:hypothetical protein